MSGADVLELSGLVVGAGGAAAVGYGLWLIAPALMFVFAGLAGVMAGAGMVWFGNRGPS